jgi:hypothetical protein
LFFGGRNAGRRQRSRDNAVIFHGAILSTGRTAINRALTINWANLAGRDARSFRAWEITIGAGFS